MTCYPSTRLNHTWWVQTILYQMQQPSTVIVKINDSETGHIISFAKWLIDQNSSNGSVTSVSAASGAVQPTNPSPDMNLPACHRLAEAQYQMRKSLLSTRSHICKNPRRSYSSRTPHTALTKNTKNQGLNALATCPTHQRRGAATMLVQWGTQKAERENLECFSACTNDAKGNVCRILERAGWSMEGWEIVLPGEDLGVFGAWRGCG